MIYLDDIKVGDTAQMGSYAVTRDEVIAFAQKYDPQPFHLSDEAAAQTHFGRVAASGWHTAAMTMSVIVGHLKRTEQAGLGSPGIDTLRWLKPVYPGDTISVATRVIDVTPSRSKPDMGSVRSDITVTNQANEPVMSYTSIVLMRKRPG